MSNQTTKRPTWRIETVRAEDLCAGDVAMIEGRWREIGDKHSNNDDWVNARSLYGETSQIVALIGSSNQDGPVGQVLVRYLLTGRAVSGGVDDAFTLIDELDLINIQVAN